MFHWLDGARIQDWSGRPEAENRLPELVRRLVAATVPSDRLRRCDFPSGTDTRLGGFDGIVEADGGSVQFVPSGLSCWELSVRRDWRKKIRADLDKRTSQLSEEERARTAFVAVTARRLEGKERFRTKLREEFPGWREICLLDAVDLAQWMQHAPAVAAWFARVTGNGEPHVLDVEGA